MTDVPEVPSLPKKVRRRVFPSMEETVRRLACEANTTEEEMLKRLERLSKGKGDLNGDKLDRNSTQKV